MMDTQRKPQTGFVEQETVRAACFFLLGIFCLSAPAAAATQVGGPITGNRTWTHEKSPYLVTMHIEVEVNASLTIEPGVAVKFSRPCFLKICGTLVAKGTASRPVVFTSEKKAPGAWEGIKFHESKGDTILQHCVVEYAEEGIRADNVRDLQLRCCRIANNEIGISLSHCRNVTIENCGIQKNKTRAIFLINSDSIEIRNNLISGHVTQKPSLINCNRGEGIQFSGNLIKDNSAVNSKRYRFALIFSYCKDLKIYNNSVTGNVGLGGLCVNNLCVRGRSKSVLSQNTIAKNGKVGISFSRVRNAKLINSNIRNNAGHGIRIYSSLENLDIQNCNITGNGGYALYNRGKDAFQAPHNWWGTAEELDIRGLIYDYWDDSSRGKVKIKPYRQAHNPDAGTKGETGPPQELFCGKEPGREPEIANVRFHQKGNAVIITYDLENGGRPCNISVKCSTDGGGHFDIRPETVSGDVGKNIAPGEAKKIRWDVLKDIPAGLHSDRIVFQVKAVRK